MSQLRCRPTSIPKTRPSLIWAFMNLREETRPVNQTLITATPLKLSNCWGESEIDSAHSMPPVISRHSPSSVARLARTQPFDRCPEDQIWWMKQPNRAGEITQLKKCARSLFDPRSRSTLPPGFEVSYLARALLRYCSDSLLGVGPRKSKALPLPSRLPRKVELRVRSTVRSYKTERRIVSPELIGRRTLETV
jgi:hypothetical protein